MTVTLGPTKLLLLGTFDEYIHSALFDPFTGQLRAGETTKSSMKPTWLTQHPILRDIVYSNGHTEGKVFCWRVSNRNTGHLEPLGEVITGGEAPTHMAVLEDGSALVVAHYRSGTTTVVPLLPEGSFAHSGPLAHYAPVPPSVTFTNLARQGAPHAHQVLLGAGPSEVYVPDLGYNRVEHLSVSARHARALEPFDGFLDADGPRHAALHPGGTHLYTLCEMSSTIVVHLVDHPNTPVARHSILPQGTAPGSKPLAAAINILPAIRSGGPHLLIASNRDLCRETGDTVALFRLDDDGAMKLLRHLEVPARHLRGVAVDAENRWVCVAGRHGGGIVVLEWVGEDGLDLAIRATLPDVKQVIAPMWVEL